MPEFTLRAAFKFAFRLRLTKQQTRRHYYCNRARCNSGRMPVGRSLRRQSWFHRTAGQQLRRCEIDSVPRSDDQPNRLTFRGGCVQDTVTDTDTDGHHHFLARLGTAELSFLVGCDRLSFDTSAEIVLSARAGSAGLPFVCALWLTARALPVPSANTAHVLKHTRTYTRTRTRTRTHAHAHTHTHTHAHARAHTHTRTHARSRTHHFDSMHATCT